MSVMFLIGMNADDANNHSVQKHRTSIGRVLGSLPYTLSIPTSTTSASASAVTSYEATVSTSTRGGFSGGMA